MSFAELAAQAAQVIILGTAEPAESIDNAVLLLEKAKALPAEKRMPGWLHFVFRRGQRDGAFQFGIVCDYAWRISLFVLLWLLIQTWWWIGLAINAVGGPFLIYKAIMYAVETKKGKQEEALGYREGHAEFWSTVISMEIANVIFSLDSFATAWAITHELPILIFATLIGVAFTRFGIAIAKPLIQERWNPLIVHAVFLLIGVVGVMLVAEIPLELAKVEIPELYKFSIIPLILVPFAIAAEIIHRRRHQVRLRQDLSTRYSIAPTGPICGGTLDLRGNLSLQFAPASLEGKRVNTVLFIDASLSRATWFVHSWFGFGKSKYEKAVQAFGAALATLDSDGKTLICLISLGKDGLDIQQLGEFTALQCSAGIRIPSSVPYGEQTNLLFGLQQAEHLLQYDGVEWLHSVVLSDGEYEAAQHMALQTAGIERREKLESGQMLAHKTYFVVDTAQLANMRHLDNLPGGTNDSADPYEVYGLSNIAAATKVASQLTMEALFPQALNQVILPDTVQIKAGKQICYDSRGEGVSAQLTTQIPKGLLQFTVIHNGKSYPIRAVA